MCANRTKLEDHRIVGGDGARIAPMPIDGELLRGERGAANLKEFSRSVEHELGDDHLCLRRRKFGSIELLRFLVATVERPCELVDGGKDGRPRRECGRGKPAD